MMNPEYNSQHYCKEMDEMMKELETDYRYFKNKILPNWCLGEFVKDCGHHFINGVKYCAFCGNRLKLAIE